jgi:hypothetical protein
MGGAKFKQTCYEIYGFDILIDKDLRPWLLEVNVSPSLSSSSPMDKYIKTLLLSDSFYLTGFHLFDRKQIEKDKAKIEKQRLLGFESGSKQSADEFVSSPLKKPFDNNLTMSNKQNKKSKFKLVTKDKQ